MFENEFQILENEFQIFENEFQILENIDYCPYWLAIISKPLTYKEYSIGEIASPCRRPYLG